MNDTERLNRAIHTAFEEFQSQYKKRKMTTYGLAFFEHVPRVERDVALSQPLAIMILASTVFTLILNRNSFA